MPNGNVSAKHLCRDVEAIPRQGSHKVPGIHLGRSEFRSLESTQSQADLVATCHPHSRGCRRGRSQLDLNSRDCARPCLSKVERNQGRPHQLQAHTHTYMRNTNIHTSQEDRKYPHTSNRETNDASFTQRSV